MEPQNQTEPQQTQPQTQPQPQPQPQQTQLPIQPQPFPQELPALSAATPPATTLPTEFARPITKRTLPRSKVLIAVGAVLSIAVGAGIGVAIVQHREDRNNETIAAARAAAAVKPAPVTGGVRSDGSHYGSLFAYLLPMPSGYTPGPYDGSYGNNSFVPAAQITSQLEDLLSGIPKSDMSSVKGALANTHLKGVAVRTMQTQQSATAVVVSVELLQFDVKDAKSAAAGFDSLVSNLNVFRNGASVPGYGQAKCVLPPGFGSDKLDEMLCVASSGDVEVVVDAQETAPLDQNSVATLVAQQLDRLKTSQSIDQ